MKLTGAVGVLLAVPLVGPTAADGGLVRMRERIEPFTVTVFTSPTPLRAGDVDLSVLVQAAETDVPLLDAHVTGVLQHVEGGRRVRFTATREAATNGLLRSAWIDLPDSGVWRVAIEVRRDGVTRTVEAEWEILEPLPAWTAFGEWLVLPIGFLVLFALHQFLRERRSSSEREASGSARARPGSP